MMHLTESDLRFLVETVATRRRDHDHVMNLIRDKEEILDQMLEDPKLVERLLNDDEMLVRISPWMLFAILLRCVQHTLGNESYVYEIGDSGQRIPVFEAPQVAELLSEPTTRDYLAEMLSSFSRTNSVVIFVREHDTMQPRRFSDTDMDEMIELTQWIDPAERPAVCRRIADIALFLSGIYPDQSSLFIATPRTAFRGRRTLQDYEQQGQRFYDIAAREAAAGNVRSVCQNLSENFTLARRALNTLSDRYLKTIQARPVQKVQTEQP